MRQSSFQVLHFGLILIGWFHLSTLKAEGNQNVTEELKFDNQSSDIFPASQKLQELKPGETIEQQVDVDETQSYIVKLEAGQTIIVTIPTHSTALNVKTFTPNAEQLAHHQQPAELFIEPILIVAEKAGDYRIDVRSYWLGKYSVNSEIPHKTTEKDKKYFAAQKLFLEYVKLRNDISKEAIRKRSDNLTERVAIY